MPDVPATTRRAGAVLLAVSFTAFAFWCGLRAAAWWAAGERGQAVIAALAMLGGLSLAVRSLRRSLRPSRLVLPGAGGAST